MLDEKGLPQFIWLGVPLTEVIAPTLFMLCLFSRLAGVGMAILTVLTIILAHLPNAFNITETGGLEVELNLLYMFGALTVFLVGPGRYALYTPSKRWLE